MIRIAVFVTILLATLLYALKKGGGPERAMALILIAMLLADQFLHLFIPPRFNGVDMGHLLIDLLAAAATFGLAMTAHRFWPMPAAVLQILPLMAHMGKAIDLSVHPVAYLTMQVAAAWVLPPLLALATWRHQMRLRTSGTDRSWYLYWRSSNQRSASR
jgi:hypothetical protein